MIDRQQPNSETVRRAKQGSRSAIERVIWALQPEIRRIIYDETGNRELVSDCAQSANRRMVEKLTNGGFREETWRAFRAFFSNLARGHAWNVQRKERRHLQKVTELRFPDDAADPDARPPEESVLAAESHQVIWEATGSLDPRTAAMIRRHFFESRSTATIATEFGVQRRAVEKRIKNGVIGIIHHLRRAGYLDSIK